MCLVKNGTFSFSLSRFLENKKRRRKSEGYCSVSFIVKILSVNFACDLESEQVTLIGCASVFLE